MLTTRFRGLFKFISISFLERRDADSIQLEKLPSKRDPCRSPGWLCDFGDACKQFIVIEKLLSIESFVQTSEEKKTSD